MSTVFIHIGQAGVNIGNECWQLFCLEHGIQPDGTQGSDQAENLLDNATATIFSESQAHKYTPRAAFVDLDPGLINDMRTGKNYPLYSQSQLISGYESAAGNYGRARCCGKEFLEVALDKIRKLSEDCSDVKSFIVTHSICGGTGSGFSSSLFERMSVDYGKKIKVHLSLFPSDFSSSVLDCYNSVLGAYWLMDHSDNCMVVDNQALFGICHRCFNLPHYQFQHVNKILAQSISSLTSAFRFRGEAPSSLPYICQQCTPYPRIHFTTVSLSPIFGKHISATPTINNITNNIFCPLSVFSSVDPRHGAVMCGALIYNNANQRVAECAAKELIRSKTVNFPDWMTESLYVVNVRRKMRVTKDSVIKCVDQSCMGVMSSSVIAEIFRKQAIAFDKYYAKRAYFHTYVGEGMDQGEFVEAREDLEAQCRDYEEVTQCPNSFGGGEEESGEDS